MARLKFPDDPVDMYVGRAIRARRRHLGLSQTSLGDAIAVTFQQVQKYERGLNRVSASTLARIAAALGADPGDFFPPCETVTHGAAGVQDALASLAIAAGGLRLAEGFPRLSAGAQAAILALMDAALGGENAGGPAGGQAAAHLRHDPGAAEGWA